MSLQAPLDALLQAGVADGSVAGVTTAVPSRDDTLYESGFGERALGSGTVMTSNTVGWIASMTKAITGVAAMQLVEQGKLDLDSPASTWAPYLGEVQVLEGFRDDGRPKLRAPKQTITLRHLLTHTAGFGYANWDESIRRYVEHEKLPASNSGDNRGLMTPLLFDPGERWLYSTAIDWVGKIVESVSGKKLGAYMTANILQPLGMTSTSFRISPEPAGGNGRRRPVFDRRRLPEIHSDDPQ